MIKLFKTYYFEILLYYEAPDMYIVYMIPFCLKITQKKEKARPDQADNKTRF